MIFNPNSSPDESNLNEAGGRFGLSEDQLPKPFDLYAQGSVRMGYTACGKKKWTEAIVRSQRCWRAGTGARHTARPISKNHNFNPISNRFVILDNLLKHELPFNSFSPINNPRIVLEISAVTEYFGRLFNPSFRKIKKSVFHDPP